MDALTRGITRHKRIVIALFLIAAVISAVLILGVSVNFDLTDYLPEDAESTVALDLMYDEFGSGVPNTRVMVQNLTLTEAAELKSELAALPGISGRRRWSSWTRPRCGSTGATGRRSTT